MNHDGRYHFKLESRGSWELARNGKITLCGHESRPLVT
jgi:hypothetical protein